MNIAIASNKSLDVTLSLLKIILPHVRWEHRIKVGQLSIYGRAAGGIAVTIEFGDALVLVKIDLLLGLRDTQNQFDEAAAFQMNFMANIAPSLGEVISVDYS